MLFAITLGVVLGAAGALLIQQWWAGALGNANGSAPGGSRAAAQADAALSPRRFPRLAPPTRHVHAPGALGAGRPRWHRAA